MDTTGRPGRPPRMSREKIVASAIEIVTEEGYAKLSMRRLADRLGTSPMGIYYYFGSKSELLGHLLSEREGLAEVRRGQSSPDPFQRAVQTADALVRFLEVHSWALAGILDGTVGVHEFPRDHLRELTRSVRDLGFAGAAADETVRGVVRIALGEAMIGAARARGAGDLGDGPACADTVESYLIGRLTRAGDRVTAGSSVGSGA